MHRNLFFGFTAFIIGNAVAAPRSSDEQVGAHIVIGRDSRPDLQSGEWVRPITARSRSGFHFNGTSNGTVSVGTATAGTASNTYYTPPYNTSSTASSSFHASACPQSVTTSFTTVDVTFYITATTSYGANLTSSRGTGTAYLPSSSSLLPVNSTSSTAVWNTTSSTSMLLSTGYTLPVNSTAVSSVAPSESPCPDDTASTQQLYPNITSTYSTSSLTTGGSDGNPSSLPVWNNTTSATPSQITEPCDDDMSSTSANSTSTAFSSQLNSTVPLSTKTTSSAAEETPCDDETSTGSAAPTFTSRMPLANSTTTYKLSTTTQNGIYSQSVSTVLSSLTSTETSATTEPCDDEDTASATPTASASTYSSIVSNLTASAVLTSSWTTHSPEVTPFLPDTSSVATSTTQATTAFSSVITTESCVIDTSMAPITTASLTTVPTSTTIPTKTVCQNDAPTGKPMPGNNHCGVHGLPVGNYFLARFVNNAPNVPVTLEGCYQFCASVMNTTDGCKSYRFYPEKGLNVPRCDLYGSTVAYALDSIDNDHPDLWFDLTCGSPSSEKWAHLPGIERLHELGLAR
ncbi:hypothetical protein CORC01_00171 [Colletotrichum orchidophilum]|uniref:Apple domain-containing protein n=1 Tax=Colletotrichum orchidophilum TaxID=1209926 RepID=A0A1G4BSC6_9PEZI|nr:uncharacterized protein CORC01_00171 [Colletotrichum orchidophilum]OHF04319.1 hypothetical protein CORC01_00171 [Colletotrichum orchidophilum]